MLQKDVLLCYLLMIYGKQNLKWYICLIIKTGLANDTLNSTYHIYFRNICKRRYMIIY